MTDLLTILYRGPLSSCNYACSYCPFAKRRESRTELAGDRSALTRFTAWVGALQRPCAVFFTPWGEALVRDWYREAIVELSHTAHRVAIQTNLHAPLDFLGRCDSQRVGLWCTFHPDQVRLSRFLRQCAALDRLGVDYSVGVVGLREHFAAIEDLRARLPAERYLWVNAYKRDPHYYAPHDVQRMQRIDPLFHWNRRAHRSLGESCRTGHSVISVTGDGNATRCHFVAETIGNIYDPEFTQSLTRRPCPNATCGCHIGYVHMERLGLDEIYGDRILERIPRAMPAGQVSRTGS